MTKRGTMDHLVNPAWELYCEETAGDLDVRDHWDELPDRVQQYYLVKAFHKNNNKVLKNVDRINPNGRGTSSPKP